MAVADGVVHSPDECGAQEELKKELEKFYEKWKDLIDDPDSLPQPLRAIATFVKKEIGG